MINGKELMIGDYVDLSNDDSNIVLGIVKGLFPKWNAYFIGIDEIGKDKSAAFEHCRTEEEIQPIKLTKKFFLKNKFRVLYTYHNVVRIYCQKDATLKIDLWQTEDGLRCSVYDDKIRVNYVHEFQHLLRLIGLSEMANNLKL